MRDVEKIAERGATSLAAQVLYQCKVFAILRDNLDRAAELLRDPVALQTEYEKRHGRDG